MDTLPPGLAWPGPAYRSVRPSFAKKRTAQGAVFQFLLLLPLLLLLLSIKVCWTRRHNRVYGTKLATRSHLENVENLLEKCLTKQRFSVAPG